MASRKQPYSWGKVSPGDIISFRYKPKSGKSPKVQTILVLNPKNKKIIIEDKIIADCLEALIGAIYLDKGLNFTEKFILYLWSEHITASVVTQIDAKTKLQEYSLKTYKKLPVYKILKLQGPKHSPFYLVGVKITSFKQHTGNGKSIKIAQQNAAKNLLMSIR